MSNHPQWLARFIEVYQQLSVDNIDTIASLYDDNVTFQDPMHLLQGKEALMQYFHRIYTHVSECRFDITQVISSEDNAAIYWQMTYRHSKLNGGQQIIVEGHSMLSAKDGLIAQHRDYVDLGAMVYQHVPVLGKVIKYINQRAAV
ncbi:nuclear transport factor 2 family protein [Thalassotalea agarivorans]|uniref:SnoaL-like domain-containing protein n=1 Tax=Thalassotalea agarivorans TaxID=349064 RepID=A0A1H9Y4I8_THASX|nr:nuclear transport factor 2 family protein [Thalassotalea agarivorans]SES63778.1 SnoaL-like domain-containing protein [Thalassotalea agarivorans]